MCCILKMVSFGVFFVRVFEAQDGQINIAPEVGGARPQIRQEAFDIP
jgi:hypothetical protein